MNKLCGKFNSILLPKPVKVVVEVAVAVVTDVLKFNVKVGCCCDGFVTPNAGGFVFKDVFEVPNDPKPVEGLDMAPKRLVEPNPIVDCCETAGLD